MSTRNDSRDSAAPDLRTARAFGESWNRIGTVYSREQFLEWFAPLGPEDFIGHDVLEMGFGNGSLLVHVAQESPSRLAGVELADTGEQTRRNLARVTAAPVEIHRGDLTQVDLGQFDLVYCIGVLHHLSDPDAGFAAVLRHVKPGGRFHCWVYAREGNLGIRLTVEPIRRIVSRLPWWITKYAVALPLVTPYYILAKTLRLLRLDHARSIVRWIPLFEYTRWIAGEPFRFFHHVAFDQLVSPRTRYLERSRILRWLSDPSIDHDTTYLILRNGNSWKFGGRKRDP
ncbi:MAG TPA: class I SAM-dependent methyltransferase [Thermoanaerobaculia bacterium]|nr:class I SAM-dependent methyltransferase [Thermoanaerobaculia bacterium]